MRSLIYFKLEGAKTNWGAGNMSPDITIDKGNKSNTLASDVNLKEEIKMSLINMAMNIGHFNIKISINRDEEKQ